VKCKHLKAYYRQLNLPDTDQEFMRRAFSGITSPYVWRIEVCRDCKSVLCAYGDVPEGELPLNYRVLKRASNHRSERESPLNDHDRGMEEQSPSMWRPIQSVLRMDVSARAPFLPLVGFPRLARASTHAQIMRVAECFSHSRARQNLKLETHSKLSTDCAVID